MKNDKRVSILCMAIVALAICSCSSTREAGALAAKTPEDALIDKNLNAVAELSPIQKYDLTAFAKEEPPDAEPPGGPYLLRPGDRMEISVLDEPEMTREVFALPDGSINYLLVGHVHAEGKSADELAESIATLLSKYLKDPKVSILLKDIKIIKIEKKARFVSVIGAVQRPGKIEISEGERLIDAISKVGGPLYINDIWGGRSVANLQASYISRNGVRLNVSFDSLLRLADMGHNILLRPDDFIYFAESDTENIIVLGEVENPNIIPFTREISLIEAISRCGGFTKKAQRGAVIVLRKNAEDTEMQKVDIAAILSGREKASNLALKSGDIVFIPEQGLSEYERYAGYLITFADLILKGYQVREQIRFPRLHRRDSHFY